MPSKTLVSKILIPIIENRNDVNSDLNIAAQNYNQHLCLDVMAFRRKRPMEYILTFNDSAKIILKVPQTIDSLLITSFIADS